MTPTAEAYWLGLRRVHGVGPRISHLLLERFGSAEAIFAAREPDLIETGIPRNTARNILEFNDFEPLERELCELPQIGARLVKWTDADYPRESAANPRPAPILFSSRRARSR